MIAAPPMPNATHEDGFGSPIQAGTPNIFDEIRQLGSGDYQYYRLPNGWIDMGQIGKRRGYEINYMAAGWKPLGGPNASVLGTRDYGVFDITEYYLEHPFELLFVRGGAHELPVAQVIALGYHLRPPLIPRCGLQVGLQHKQASGSRGHLSVCWRGAKAVRFPQLEGLTFESGQTCPFCARDHYVSTKARNQHVRVMHKEEMAQMTLADAIVAGVRASQGSTPTADALTPEEAEALAEARRAAEQRAIDEKMRAMGLLDDGTDDEALLAASVADGTPEPTVPARTKRTPKKTAPKRRR